MAEAPPRSGEGVRDDSPTSTSSNPPPGVPWKLTVDKQSKIEREMAARERLRNSAANRAGSTVLSVTVLLVVAALMFLACLICISASKVTVVNLANQLMVSKVNKSAAASVNDQVRELRGASAEAESVICMILIIVLIPYALTFLRSLWSGGFRTDRPWPSWLAILWGVFCSLLEAAGISLFILEVLSKSSLTGVEKVSLFSGVFFVAMLLYVISEPCCNDPNEENPRPIIVHKVFAIISIILLVGGVSLVCYDDIRTSTVNGNFWMIPLSLILLGIAWCPQSQRLQIKPNLNQLKRLFYKRRAPAMMNRGVTPPNPQDPIDMSIVYTDLQFSARWKASIINSFLKIVFTIIFCIVYSDITKIIDAKKLHDGLFHITPSHPVFTSFIVNIFCSAGGYVLAWIACTVCLQQQCFALPLMFAAPACIIFTALIDTCKIPNTAHLDRPIMCTNSDELYKKNVYFIAASTACFVFAQILGVACFVWKASTIRMQAETQLFWLPNYSSVFLDSLMTLTRISSRYGLSVCPVTGRPLSGPTSCRGKQTRTVICTTMYREAAHEMSQLLHSLSDVNKACQQDSGRDFQAHIVFDNGVRDTRLTHFALQLVSLCKKSLGVQIKDCKKISTPYGMQLKWELPVVTSSTQEVDVEHQHKGMELTIHLKDNQKVKNKKRWSQVMYMSYVLDYLIREDVGSGDTSRETFILTTDADVKFTHESVETLLDLMHRSQNVGAVCARTHPMGSGPVYWYQIFDYAIGHWLQKSAEHVLGSVLCSPGCFSVYRAEAIRDVLKTYSSKVEMASEFLTKDMGEDRYLATLLVQSGWRLEYCAAAGIETFCPEEFNEFFQQRRRWLPSTLANQILLLKEWRKTVSHLNKQISGLFLCYQAALLFATFINPAVSILVVVGGLYYAWGINQILSTVVFSLIVVFYTLICIYGTPENQLKTAKILTFIFALIMGAVFVGTIAQIVDENAENHMTTISPSTVRPPTEKPNTTKSTELEFQKREMEALEHIVQTLVRSNRDEIKGISDVVPPTESPMPIKLPVSVSTIYIAVLTGIFLIAAIVHPTESYCLIHGIWYLLCLPAGNVLLLIYSVCNLTDGSWGTREEKKDSVELNGESWIDQAWNYIKRTFPCCRDTDKTDKSVKMEMKTEDDDETKPKESKGKKSEPDLHKTVKALRPAAVQRSDSSRRFKTHGESWVLLEKWLPENLRALYAGKFVEKGFDDTSFVVGLTDKELKDYIGVASKPHRYAILEAVRLLPELDIEPCVPKNVDDWLELIGLDMYSDNFRRFQIVTSNNLEILKAMSREDIQKELEINKPGHLKRLLLAIDRLRYPNRTETEIYNVKREIENKKPVMLEEINEPEFNFWESLKNRRLKPSSLVFANAINLKEKLHELRNSALMMLAITNSMWLLLICTLATKTDLNLLQTNVLGLMFLVVFGLILSIQFLCMLAHRVATWMHKIARAPRRCGQASQADFAFTDTDPDDLESSGNLEGSHGFENSIDLRAGRRQRARATRARSGAANSIASFFSRGRSTIGPVTEERRPLIPPSQGVPIHETDIH